MNPVVLSIVIPVYNTANYLESCLSSVLAGDWADCEILLVDDGSTMASAPGCATGCRKRIPALVPGDSSGEPWPGRSPKHRPGGSQRGISFFLDSDDTIPPYALTTLKEAIRKTGAEIIAFQFLTDDGEGHRTPYCANAVQLDTPFTTRQKPEFLLSIPSACCRIWRRSLFLSSGIRFPSRVWVRGSAHHREALCAGQIHCHLARSPLPLSTTPRLHHAFRKCSAKPGDPGRL